MTRKGTVKELLPSGDGAVTERKAGCKEDALIPPAPFSPGEKGVEACCTVSSALISFIRPLMRLNRP
ncbi:MAG TPA: hypothetical protein PK573_14710, partial [Spirochaetota bacterium]|nr:hypothetical protein [Spirochaetota bacterium]